MPGKRTSAAKKTAGIKGKRITAKQRVARKKNIAVARSHKKKAVKKAIKREQSAHDYDKKLGATKIVKKKSYSISDMKSIMRILAARSRVKRRS